MNFKEGDRVIFTEDFMPWAKFDDIGTVGRVHKHWINVLLDNPRQIDLVCTSSHRCKLLKRQTHPLTTIFK